MNNCGSPERFGPLCMLSLMGDQLHVISSKRAKRWVVRRVQRIQRLHPLTITKLGLNDKNLDR